jgi:cyclic beta-1,2-glucan synthetase
MPNTDSIHEAQQISPGNNAERLRGAVQTAAAWEVVPRPTGRSAFFSRVDAAAHALRQLETRLAKEKSANGDLRPVPFHAAVNELRVGRRLMHASLAGFSGKPPQLALLPRVVFDARPDEPRVAALAEIYLQAVEGEFSADQFRSFLRDFQSRESLALDELWNISAFLKFSLLESVLEDSRTLLRSKDPERTPLISARLKSLAEVSNADWVFLIEPLIEFDALLRQDPEGSYARMEFNSRELYRKRVAYVARHSDCTEFQVAEAALELAREGGREPAADERVQRRRIHVGHYLLDRGFPQLAQRVGFHPPVTWRVRQFVLAHGEDFYITGVQLLTIFFLAALLLPILPRVPGVAGLAAIVFFAMLPVMQVAVDLVNSAVMTFFDPQGLPKIDFSKGIAADCTTLAAVPTLLSSEKQVRELVNELEVRFLANRDPHLHFALLTDLPDSVSKPRDRDSHPLVELAVRLIGELNEKYASPRNGCFLLLHRHRIFNTRQGVWMGWERKRGKLLDLNKLLAHEYDAFPIKAGRLDVLGQVRYILTLDSDTQLPHGAAARLAGAMAHPLNRAVIDPRLRIVTAGYGILQPRIGVTVRSTARSRLAAIYSGQGGFDIYSRAISDAYQDLFGEGIFTGKGIYEVATFHAVLNRRFPRNALLSHDLIEGAYARAGLVSDVELVDDYPSRYSAYSRRKHRWVRGDWQIGQWMLSRVPDESGHWGANPISDISRWKIFDNLRRSLVEPFLFLLFAAGWFGLPGGRLYWTLAPLVLLVLPSVVQLGFGLGRALASRQAGRAGDVLSGFGQSIRVALLNLAFLPHQSLLAFDAIIRSLVRRFITGGRLMEWETAAQAESAAGNRAPVDRYLALVPLVTIALGVAIFLFAKHNHHEALYFALPLLVLWSSASILTSWLNKPPGEQMQLYAADKTFLLGHALRIWRFFHEFGVERHSYLIPDNVEEDGMAEAARVSPTNIGLLLNARQAACELGFITVPEFASLTLKTLATIRAMDKFRGHLFNWYDTKTHQPLNASRFVSSVDSGNFVASLYTLHAGARDVLKQPLISHRYFTGLREYWQMMQRSYKFPSAVAKLPLPRAEAALAEWIGWLPAAQAALQSAAAAVPASADSWWLTETTLRVEALQALLREYLPWLLPEYALLRPTLHIAHDEERNAHSIETAIVTAEVLPARLANAESNIGSDPQLKSLSEQFGDALSAAAQNLRALAAGLREIAGESERLAAETDFSFLADENRQILSIGYEAGPEKLHPACYDLIASEARIATFLAIARGDLPPESWLKLARDHTQVYNRFILLSWSGTMFEYLMPALWMRSYHGTMIAQTQDAAVHVQREFARGLGLPWGISESGGARKTPDGPYHYHAYGVPNVSLWIEAMAGPVISPYSTFLALGTDAAAALRNLRFMESAKWVGSYGFYEAADYTASRRKPVLVHEWMAHHLGMSLLAIVNVLHENVMQRWFHANPLVQSAELLLQEKRVGSAILRARLQEFTPVHSG